MEHTDLHNGRIVKRRIMEAQGGAEVRRLHILYFLSRNGRNEHPHLIRIHHLSNNGVRLRDIKRWLGELRGKDMPESFAWSYKRTYKTGYVWQDILDDDLVTPISDNEYVLKGSEISSTTHNIDFSRPPTQKEQPSQQESTEDSQNASSKDIQDDVHSSDSSNYVSSKTPSFGSETSTSTDDSVKHRLEESTNRSNHEAGSNEKKRKTNKLETINVKSNSKTDATSDKPHQRKSHPGSIFRNFISCGGIDTNDSAVVMTSKRYKPFLKTCSGNSADGVRDSAREKGRCRAPRAAWPLYGPNCSQCGKTFKPEKLQSHMNSCKGMKALAKASYENLSKKSTASRNEDSVSAYLLTQNC